MKYRTKLYLALVSIAFVSTTIGLWVIYYDTGDELLGEIKSQVITVAATSSALIDPTLVKELIANGNEESRAYLQLKQALLRVLKENQREDIFVRYIYIVKPNPDDPHQLIYLVDSETDPANINHLGDIEPMSQIIGLLENNHKEENFSPKNYITDTYGTWLSGYAPIRDAEGHYLASLGVDLSAHDVFRTLSDLIHYELTALVLSLVAAIIGAFFLSRRATHSLNLLSHTVKEIGKGNLTERIHLKTEDEFRTLAETINSMAVGLQERERMKMNFARYVSSHIMDRILQSETPLKLEGEKKKVTLLFSDIKEFTRLAEKQPPEIIVSLLNEYFETMINLIFKHNGTLDKFLGDGLMVEFGAPLDDPLEEENAITTALEMQSELKKLCAKWEKEGKPTFKIGIGIHTGIAILGTIGSEQRMEYTAIGDTVNIASRIQTVTRKLNQDILISETTYRAVKDKFVFESLGPIPLTGHETSLSLYTVKKKPTAP